MGSADAGEIHLLRRLGGVKLGHQLQVVVQSGQKTRRFQRPVDGDLGGLDANGGDIPHLAGHALALRQQISVRHHPVDHTDAGRFVGVNDVAGEHHLFGGGQIDGVRRHQKGRAVAQPDFRFAQHSPVGGDFDIADLHQFAGAAQGVAVDGGDDGLAQVPHHQKGVDVGLDAGAASVHGQGFSAGAAGFGFNIKAGGKGPSGAGEDDHPDIRVGFNPFQSLPELRHQGLAEGVQLVRAVQRQVADALLLLVKQRPV